MTGDRGTRGVSALLARLLAGDDRTIRRFGPIYLGAGSFTWWVATLFMIGSACFVIGTVIAVSARPAPAGIVYFIGSIFFTTAGYGQLLSALNAGRVDSPRLFGRVDSVDWKASAIQSFGTVCFNVSTGFALVHELSTAQAKRLVWAPDAIGSIAFLWSSWLAFAAIRASWRGHPRRGATWASALMNLIGSIFFGWSAVGAYVIPDTGELANALAANAGTFFGAVCFFIGAWLAWPEAAAIAERERRA